MLKARCRRASPRCEAASRPTIRRRMLKDDARTSGASSGIGFATHDPTEDAESVQPPEATPPGAGFATHDPTEDAESWRTRTATRRPPNASRPTIRRRMLKGTRWATTAVARAGLRDPRSDGGC